MSGSYILGLTCGIAATVILLAVLLKWMDKDGKMKITPVLDERQERARGIGFKYGFFTCLILLAIYAFLLIEITVVAENPRIFIAAIIMISVTVYACYSIRNDAYMGLNENPKRVMVAFLAIGLFNGLIAVLSSMVHHEPLIENGIIASPMVNLLCAVMMFVLDAVYFFHQKREEREEN